jgi:hypothetical protein
MFKFRVSQFKTGAAIAAATVSTIVLSSAAPANALSFSVEPAGVITQPTWGGLTNTVIDFNSAAVGSVPNGATPLIGPTNTNGGVTIDRITGNARYDNINPTELFSGGSTYLAVGRNNGGSNNTGGAVQLTFAAPKGVGYFGLFWASPSINDQIVFTLKNPDGSLAPSQTVTAANVFGSLPGYVDTSVENQGRYVNFFVTSSDTSLITQVLLQDLNDAGGNRSFEVDNIAYHQIPTPALLPGLVGLGFGILKKKRRQEAMAAV